MAPRKRKSSEGLDAGKKLKVSGGKPDPGKLQTMLHVGKLSEWLLEKVMPVGGPSAYLATMYPDQDSLLKFAEWIDTFAPADGSKVYASSTDRPCLLRPWMLGFRSDFGVSGFLDPEVGELLIQLILTEGFSSDPDRVGAEKLSMTAVPKAYLEAEYIELPACIGSGMLPPFSCAYVKGWKRGVTLLIALHGIRELGLEGEIPHWVKVTFGTIHASFGTFADDTKGKVMANRGATLQHTATRRPPHCFNFLRQVEIIERSGGAGVLQQMEEWTNATSLAKAFSLGKLESEAIFNLRLRVPAAVLKVLTEAVKQRGLAKLLTHDVIARDCFNQNFSSGVNAMEQWKEELRNRDGNELALLFVQRLLSDHDSTPPQLRKPLTFREALGKHQACGGFLHYLRLLQQMAPAADYPEMEKDLKQQFRYGYLDPDILHSLETMVPPGDIQMVGAFRTYVARVEQSARSEKMKREADLAANVRAADLTQLLARLEADMELLSSKENNSASRAAETAKDMKYLWDRQLKGERWVDEWMAENCKLLECDQDMHAAMPGLLAFKEQFRGIAGKEYIMCTYDCTVFPSNATYVRQTGLCASNILSLSSGAFCHLQFPVYQPQTSASAVLKHRRILEDQFMRSNLNILLPVQLLFSKAEGGARDNRSLNQPCLALLHNNFEASEWQRSEPVQQGKIGPVPLLRFSDFLGYDDTTRPSSQGRVEQKGVDAHMGIISSYMQGMEIKPEDRLIICDILPNKQFEFGRAVVQQRLAEPTSPWRYIGFVKKLDGAQPSALGDILKALRSQVWDFWDSSSHAPPKTRPQEGGAGADAVPDLQVLAFQGGHPVWPEVLLNRFPEGTSEHDALKKQEEFLRKFPRAPEVSSSRATGLPPRAGGLCDFSIDNGLRPLDVTKQVSLTCVKESDFTVTRLGSCAMRSGRPALVLTSTYDLWVGNTSDNVVNLDAGELFGFSTGNYEEVTFPSGVLVEPSGLLLRFTSDLQLIVSEEKKIMALCEYLRFLATEKGIGSLTIEDHKMEPRMHEAEAGREAMPICFRYQISCLDSGKTHMFKPNAFDSESPTPTHRTFGALYNSAYDKVARNDFARVLWEVETSSSPPVVMAKKPKMYLTCSLSMEPRSWYKLT